MMAATGEWWLVLQVVFLIGIGFLVFFSVARRLHIGHQRRKHERKEILGQVLAAHQSYTLKISSVDSRCQNGPPSTAENTTETLAVKKILFSSTTRQRTKAVLNRAVVVVGGDFARSPRMQYHALSLAQSGWFDEVILLGYDEGNKLSEALLQCEKAEEESFAVWKGDVCRVHECADDTECPLLSENNSGTEEVRRVIDRFGQGAPATQQGIAILTRPAFPSVFSPSFPYFRQTSCPINTSMLFSPPKPPAWVQGILPSRLFWLFSAAYRVSVLCLIFTILLLKSLLINVNARGQVQVTTCVLGQTPPCIPVLLIMKYIVRPIVLLYSLFFYYVFLLPLSLFSWDWVRELHSSHEDYPLWGGATANPQGHPSEKNQNRLNHANWRGFPRRVLNPTVIVDWHNYGYTLLEAVHSPKVVSKLYKTLELNFCAGDVNLTVSHAMRSSLLRTVSRVNKGKNHAIGYAKKNTWSAVSNDFHVLYDSAPQFFAPASRRKFVEEVLIPISQQTLPRRESGALSAVKVAQPRWDEVKEMVRVSKSWGINPPPAWVVEELEINEQEGVDTFDASSVLHTRRGLIVVGSTSWTPDDDYTILIEALRGLDARLCHPESIVGAHSTVAPMLEVWVLITGKGASRARFETQVESAGLSSHIVVSTVYLQSYQQYSVTLGAADVGLCLHLSSSGLDLPMKGVDMLGAGLPIMAVQYQAIDELLGGRRSENISKELTASSSGINDANNPGTHHSVASYDYGWTFQTASDLEKLLFTLVGGPSSLLEMNSKGSHNTLKGEARFSLNNEALSPILLAIRHRVAERRIKGTSVHVRGEGEESNSKYEHAASWEEQYSLRVQPILQELVKNISY